jgi:cell division septation protein DedD
MNFVFAGIMVAAMRSILDDILPYMSTGTDTDNDTASDSDSNKDRHSGIGKNTDSDVHSNTDTDTDTHSNTVNNTDINIHEAEKTIKGSDRDRINTSHDTQNGTSPLFEFFPHISPKLADNWDFKSTLEAVAFPSNDSVNIANWLKKRRKHDITQHCMGSNPVSEEDEFSTSERDQSGGCKEGCGIEGGRGECSATIIGDDSTVMTPTLLSTTTPVPVPKPTSTPVPSSFLLQTPTPVLTSSSIPVPTPIHVPTLNPVPTPAHTPVRTPIPETASPYPLGSLSIQMGEFTKVYSHVDQENQFDCVVTCFFIDTATDILEYLAVIAHVLREGANYFLIYFFIV